MRSFVANISYQKSDSYLPKKFVLFASMEALQK